MNRAKPNSKLIPWGKAITLIWLMLAPYLLFADALPSFSRRYEIHLTVEGKALDADSIRVYWRNGESAWETCAANNCHTGLWPDLSGELKEDRHGYWDECRIIVWKGGKEWPELRVERGTGIYRKFDLRNGEWQDVSPFFHYPTKLLLYSLLITVLLELLLLLWFLRKQPDRMWSASLGLTVANIITQFALWFLTASLGWNVWLVEIGIAFTEGLWLLFLMRGWSPGYAMRLSFIVNLVSFVVGSILMFILFPV